MSLGKSRGLGECAFLGRSLLITTLAVAALLVPINGAYGSAIPISGLLLSTGASAIGPSPSLADFNPDDGRTGYDDMDDPSPCPSQNMGPGLHVDPASGNVSTTVPILSVSCAGEETLHLDLVYNSWLKNHGGIGRSMGFGWTHSYDLGFVEVKPQCNEYEQPGPCPPPDDHLTCMYVFYRYFAPPRVILIDGDGRRNAYTMNGRVDEFGAIVEYPGWGQPSAQGNCPYDPPFWLFSGTPSFQAPPGRNGKLELADPVTSDKKYVLTFPDGTKRFYGSHGHVTSIVSPRGAVTAFSYTNVGDTEDPWFQLNSVCDAYSHCIEFVYDAAAPEGKLIEIIHPETTPEHAVKTILTHGDSLDSITDPEGQSVYFEYESLGRMTREQLKNGVAYTCEYVEAPFYDDPENPPPAGFQVLERLTK